MGVEGGWIGVNGGGWGWMGMDGDEWGWMGVDGDGWGWMGVEGGWIGEAGQGRDENSPVNRASWPPHQTQQQQVYSWPSC